MLPEIHYIMLLCCNSVKLLKFCCITRIYVIVYELHYITEILLHYGILLHHITFRDSVMLPLVCYVTEIPLWYGIPSHYITRIHYIAGIHLGYITENLLHPIPGIALCSGIL